MAMPPRLCCAPGLATSPQANIGRFDFGVCMCFWEGGNLVFTADQFKRDAEAKTFTLYRADNREQFAYSMSRFRNLTRDRYTDWTLAVPDEFEELLKEHTFRQHWYKEDAHFGIEIESPQILRPKSRPTA
jgi:hypothetical protein